MATSSLSIKEWPKFDGSWYTICKQKVQMKFEMEDLWELVFGVEKHPSSSQEINPTTTPPTNQAIITTWKKRDHVALVAIWDYVDNSIFSYIGACNTTNEVWLVFKIYIL